MLKKIKDDWNNYKVGILAAMLYLVISTLVLGDACPSMIFLKLPCPGCGLTRAFFCFCTFRWKMAWNMNAMIFPLMLFSAWCFYFRYMRNKRIPFFYGGIAMWCIGAVFYFFAGGRRF